MSLDEVGAHAAGHPPARAFRAGLGRRLPRGYVRLGPLLAVPRVLRAFGVAPEAVLRDAGISLEVFEDPDNAVPYVVASQMLAASAKAIDRDDVGLLICEETGASELGLVGFLLKQAPDVGTALDDLVRYLHHQDRGSVSFLRTGGGQAILGYSILEPNSTGIEIIYDCAIAIAYNIVRGLCGPRWSPSEVLLSRRRPTSVAHYERFFGAPVRFDAEFSAVSFAEHWLDTPNPHCDPALRRVLKEQIELLEQGERESVSDQVRRLLRTALLTRAGSAADIAGMLRINRRTLTRRLEVEGTSFRQLTEEVQYEIARQLIENTTMSMTQISLTLRYSEASAFSRAFRQWSGMTPRAWRARHAAGTGPASSE